LISRYEQFTALIANLHKTILKIERDEMIQYGYKGGFAPYLAAMNRYPDGVTAAQLCEICDKDKAAVSRMLGEMAEHHLVVRKNDQETYYRAPLLLTEEGKKAADFVCRRAQAAVEAVGQGLTDENRKIFYSVMDLISANLEKVSRQGLPRQINEQKEEYHA